MKSRAWAIVILVGACTAEEAQPLGVEYSGNNPSVVPDTFAGVRCGDMNLDGQLDGADRAAFEDGLADAEAYERRYFAPPRYKGDCNNDGNFDFEDGAAFGRLFEPRPVRAVKKLALGTPTERYWWSALSANGRYAIFGKDVFLTQFTIFDTWTDTETVVHIPNHLKATHQYYYPEMAISGDGRYLALTIARIGAPSPFLYDFMDSDTEGVEDVDVIRYDLETGQADWVLPLAGVAHSAAPSISAEGRRVTVVAFLEDGRRVAYIRDFWQNSFQPIHETRLFTRLVNNMPSAAILTEDASTLFVPETVGGNNNGGAIINLSPRQVTHMPSGAYYGALSADGGTFIYREHKFGGENIILDRKTGTEVARMPSPGANNITTSHEGAYFTVTDRVYHVPTRTMIKTGPVWNGNSFTISQDARYIVFTTAKPFGQARDAYIAPNPLFLEGDYDRSGRVDHGDFLVWEAGDARADGNQDGVVDAADYAWFRKNEGRTLVIPPEFLPAP
jgi:hypothetical protein